MTQLDPTNNCGVDPDVTPSHETCTGYVPGARFGTTTFNWYKPGPDNPPNVTIVCVPPMVTTGTGLSEDTTIFSVSAGEGAKPVPKISMVSPGTAGDAPAIIDGSPTTMPFI